MWSAAAPHVIQSDAEVVSRRVFAVQCLGAEIAKWKYDIAQSFPLQSAVQHSSLGVPSRLDRHSTLNFQPTLSTDQSHLASEAR